MTSSVPRIAIISGSMGAGHDGVAAELARRLAAAGHPVDRHDVLELLPPALAGMLVDGYTHSLRLAPWAYRTVMAAVDRAAAARLVARTCRAAETRLLAALHPDTAAAVSTFSLASQSLGRLRCTGRLPVPVITYLTDPAVHRTWIAPGSDAYLTPYVTAAAAARRFGAATVRVVSPAVSPDFHPACGRDEIAATRTSFRLPAADRLALIVAGSLGLGNPARTAREVLDTGLATPVVVCGRHTLLRRQLSGIPGVHALGWVDQMPSLMRAADLIIDNAGGLTCLEALTTGLPVLMYRPLAGHGHANAAQLDAAGLVPWVRDPADLRPALAAALAGRRQGATAAEMLAQGGDPANWIIRAAVPNRSTVAMP